MHGHRQWVTTDTDQPGLISGTEEQPLWRECTRWLVGEFRSTFEVWGPSPAQLMARADWTYWLGSRGEIPYTHWRTQHSADVTTGTLNHRVFPRSTPPVQGTHPQGWVSARPGPVAPEGAASAPCSAYALRPVRRSTSVGSPRSPSQRRPPFLP